MSKIWQHTKDTYCGTLLNCEIVAFQRVIGKIYPASSKGHNFIFVAIDYFTEWVEAVPLEKAKQNDVILSSPYLDLSEKRGHDIGLGFFYLTF